MKTTWMKQSLNGCVAVMVALWVLTPAAGQAASWNQASGGTYNWNVNTNPPWDTGSFPNGTDAQAYLTNDITGNQTIDLGQAITLGQLSIGDASAQQTFVITNTTANPLTFQASGGTAYLIKMPNAGNNNSSVTITPNITLASNLTISNLVANTDSTPYLTLSGNISESGGSRTLTLYSTSWNGVTLSGSNSYSGGTVLNFHGDPTYVAVLNPNALGAGPVTTATGGSGRILFNLTAPATFTQNMTFDSGNGFTLDNASANPVTLNGALSGGGGAYFYLTGSSGNGGFVLGGANTSTTRLLTDNTSATIMNSGAINNFAFAILTDTTGHTGKLYLANGVAMTKGVYYNQFANITANNTPVYLGMSGAGAASISGVVDLNYRNSATSTAINNFYLDVPTGGTLTLSGQIQNSNTYATNELVKIGAGTVVFSNTGNNYGGDTTISAGTLGLGAANVIPDGAGKGNVIMNPSSGTATLDLGGFSETINGLSSSGAGTSVVTNSSATAATLTVGNNNQTSSFGGNIVNGAGTINLTKTGSGTLTLTGANTYSGTTTVGGGTLALSSPGSLNTAGQIVVSAASGATLNISGTLATTSGQGARAIDIGTAAGQSGTINVSGSGSLTTPGLYIAEDTGGTGLFTQSGGTVSVGNSSVWLSGNTSTLTVSGGSFTDAGSLYLGFGNGGISTSTVNVNGTGALTVGAMQFGQTGRNGFTANVNVGNGSPGGTLQVNNIIWGGATSAGSTMNFNGGTLVANGTFSTPTQVATVVQSGGALISVLGSYNLTIPTGLTDGGGGGGLTKLGPGTLTLSGPNTYTGATTVSNGTLTVNGSQTGNGAYTIAAAGKLNGIADLSGHNVTDNGVLAGTLKVGIVSGSGSVDPGNSPGILTAAQVDPTSNLSFNFEFTALAPTYGSPLASGNDVLQLTGSSPFTAALTSNNMVNLYLSSAIFPDPTILTTFRGGFYTDLGGAFLSSIQNATYHVYWQQAGGATTYNGTQYTLLGGTFGPVRTVADNGLATGGYVMQFDVYFVPEPSVVLLLGLGGLVVAARRKRRG